MAEEFYVADDSFDIDDIDDEGDRNNSDTMTTTPRLLQNNKLGMRKHTFSQSETAKMLQEAQHAKHVSLSSCKVTEGQEEPVYDLFADFFRNNHELESLEMATELVSLDHDATLLLLKAATYTTTLKRLKLLLYNTAGHSQALEQHVEALVASNPMLRELVVLVPGIPSLLGKLSVTMNACRFLQSLDFSNMSMGDVALASFAQGVSAWPLELRHSLKELALSRNRLSHAALPYLTDLLNHFVNLQFLDLCGNGALFRFSDATDGFRKSQFFMGALGAHPSLAKLMIRACSIKNKEAHLLFEALTHENNVMRHLDLDYNLIEIHGVLHLREALPRLHALQVLEMDDLELTEEENEAMEGLVDENYHIERWSSTERQSFVEALKQNFSLTDLRLDSRLLTRADDDVLDRVHRGNRFLHSAKEALDQSSCSEATLRVFLEQSGQHLQNEPRRHATTLYNILCRRQW